MTRRSANTTGDLSSATLWDTVTNTPTMHASTNTSVSTTARFTATFTAPNTTNKCKGVWLYLVGKGTYDWTVTLQENSVDTAAAVTVSNATLPSQQTWVYFQFATPYTFTAITAGWYRFKVQGSGVTTSSGTAASDSGASLYCYLAVDDRAGALGATDDLYIAGPNEGAGYTVTVKNGDSWGAGGTGTTALTSPRSINNAVVIGKGSTLKWDTAASTSATCMGPICSMNGGELQIGTVASPYPAGKTATLIFNQNGVTASAGIRNYVAGKTTFVGQPLTYYKTKLASGTLGVPGDPLVTADPVDWSVGDEVIVGATSNNATNYAETENRTILTKNSSTSYEFATANLLSNGDFETPGGGGADVFANWTEVPGAGGTVTATTTAGEVHSGTTAVRLDRTTTTAEVTQTFGCTPSTIYEIRLWSRGDGTNAMRYGVQDVTGAAVDIIATTTLANTSTTYAETIISFTTPVACTSVKLRFYSPSVNGSFGCYDDISFRQGLTLNFAHTTDAWVLNLTRNVLVKTNSTAQAQYFFQSDTTGNLGVNLKWARLETIGNAGSNLEGYRFSTNGAYQAIDYCVFYRPLYRGLYFSGVKNTETFTGNIICNQNSSTNVGALSIGSCSNQNFTDTFVIKNNRDGYEMTADNGCVMTRCIAISNNTAGSAIQTPPNGGFYLTSGSSSYVDCEAHCNRVIGTMLNNASGSEFLRFLSGTKGTNAADLVTITDTLNTILFTNSLFASAVFVQDYLTQLPGSEIKFKNLQGTTNNHIWYTNYGTARATGATLADTTVRTPNSLGIRLAPEDGTDGFVWEFNIPAKAQSIVNFFGWFRKNTAFGTDVARVELWLPDSAAADATFTLTNTTEMWQAAVLSASNTQTIDGLATVKVFAVSATAGAYLYGDDFYNAGDTVTSSDKVTGLDTWFEGKPVSIITPQATSAADIWTFPTSQLTTAGTTGKALNDTSDDLTTGKFIALK